MPMEPGSQTEQTEQIERTEPTEPKQGNEQTSVQTTLDLAVAQPLERKRRSNPMKGMKRPDRALRMLGNKYGRFNRRRHPRLSTEARRKLAERMRGNTFGHLNKGIPKSEQWKRKASLAKMGDRNPMRNPIHARKMANTKRGKPNPKVKEYWRLNHDEQIRRMMAGERSKPNRVETRLIQLIQRNELPFKYVGNWELIVDGKCPDFVHKEGKKLLIELFGDYWHKGKGDDRRKG